MKKIYKYLFITIIGISIYSCEKNEIPIFDAQNGRAIAGINATIPSMVFNPVENSEKIITIGVSSLSDSPRAVSLRVKDTLIALDESYYTISTLNPVIQPGEFTTDITITTLGSTVLPNASATVTLELVSVEGAEILPDSIDEVSIGLEFQCPDVVLANVVGSAVTLENGLLPAFGVPITFSDPRTVVSGPADDQITIIGGISPDLGGTDVILTIDLETGFVTDAEDGGVSFINAGRPIPTTNISGKVLTCINQIDINIENGTFAPPFNSLKLKLQIQ